MINIITSKNNSRIKQLIKLKQSKYRQEMGYFLVEGFHSVEMAYKANLLIEIYSLKPIDNLDVDQYIISKDILDKITTSVTAQGIVAKCFMKKALPISNNIIIYLDNISDPGNLGTILRTALAFNIKDLMLSKDCVSLYNDKVLAATQGALFALNVVKSDFEKLVELKNSGYSLVATSLKDSIALNELPNLKKIVIIFGNEGNGIRQEILNICDYKVNIPISNIDSLNVGVAAGIVLYHLNEKYEKM